MKNKVYITDDGTKVYKDRSVGVVLVITTVVEGTLFFLANKRGARTTDAPLLWNVPSGYLDWDETGEEAAARETKEECGITIPLEYIREVEHSTSPKENRQNVIFRYLAKLPEEYFDIPFSTKDSEEDEVRDIKWIPFWAIDEYDFAWGQKETIERIIFNNFSPEETACGEELMIEFAEKQYNNYLMQESLKHSLE